MPLSRVMRFIFYFGGVVILAGGFVRRWYVAWGEEYSSELLMNYPPAICGWVPYSQVIYSGYYVLARIRTSTCARVFAVVLDLLLFSCPYWGF